MAVAPSPLATTLAASLDAFAVVTTAWLVLPT
jgi:hypothetical protein